MTQTFTIEGRLSGLNDIIKVARYNRFAGASQKKQETKRCCWAIIAAGLESIDEPFQIEFKWVEPNLKRDPDNICGGGTKFILDALVELKKIPNDSARWVKGISHTFSDPDPKNPRVEVTLTEV